MSPDSWWTMRRSSCATGSPLKPPSVCWWRSWDVLMKRWIRDLACEWTWDQIIWHLRFCVFSLVTNVLTMFCCCCCCCHLASKTLTVHGPSDMRRCLQKEKRTKDDAMAFSNYWMKGHRKSWSCQQVCMLGLPPIPKFFWQTIIRQLL